MVPQGPAEIWGAREKGDPGCPAFLGELPGPLSGESLVLGCVDKGLPKAIDFLWVDGQAQGLTQHKAIPGLRLAAKPCG